MWIDWSEFVTYSTDYCSKFAGYKLQPLVCLLRVTERTTTTQTPPFEFEEEWEEDCGCELSCFPISEVTDPDDDEDEGRKLGRRISPLMYCPACGESCAVDTLLLPKCNCLVLGSSTAQLSPKPTCRCSVTCAPTNDRDEDPYCIYRVNGMKGVSKESPYTCDCDKTKRTQLNPLPHFACVCQPN